MSASYVNAQRPDNYQPTNPNVEFSSSTLPVVRISTGGQTIDRRQTCQVDVAVEADTYEEGKAEMKYWGTTVFTHQAKKPLVFRMLESDRQYMLLPLYSDRSLVRAQLTNVLARQTMEGLPATNYCELVVDGVYYGLYLLADVVENIFRLRSTTRQVGMVDYMLLAELSHDVDCYRYNVGNVDAGARVCEISPMHTWLGYGNNYSQDGYRTDTWIYEENGLLQAQDDPWLVPEEWISMAKDAEFRTLLKETWNERRSTIYSDERINEVVDSLASLLRESGALQRNFQAWPIWSRRVWPNHYLSTSYEEELAWLRQWIAARCKWMDDRLSGAEVIVEVAPVSILSGFTLDVVAEAEPGSTHTTGDLDGSNYVYYSKGLRNDGGLPEDGLLTSEETGVTYQMADYDSNNVLKLLYNGYSGTLEFGQPINAQELYFLVTSTSGDGTYTVTVNYQDGSHSSKASYGVSDWWAGGGGGGVVTNLYRYNRSTNQLQTNAGHFRLSESQLSTDSSKPIVSVTFTSTSASSWEGYQPYVCIFGVSAKTERIIDHAPSVNIDGKAYELMRFNSGGQRIDHPVKGLNILRMSDGTTRKVMVK